jgi:23S rRNA (uracil1939-C5)-methyltransferase
VKRNLNFSFKKKPEKEFVKTTSRRTTLSAMIECEHFPECSGCMHVDNLLENNPVVAQARAFFRSERGANEEGEKEFHISLGKTEKYRNKAKLVCRRNEETGEIDLGLFKKNTHDMVPIPNCAIHHPSINLYSKVLIAVLRDLKVTPYDEKKLKGDLRYVQFVAPDFSKKISNVQITLVWNDVKLTKLCSEVCEKFHATCASLFTDYPPPSVFVNFNVSRNNTIFERNAFELVAGTDEFILANDIAYGPGSFMQGNLEMHLETLRDIVTELDDGEQTLNIVDLFSGSGAIGFYLAKELKTRVQSVEFVEISPDVQRNWEFTKNKIMNSLPSAPELHLTVAPAGTDAKAFFQKKNCEVVIVNPPRKGCGKEVLEALTNDSSDNLGPSVLVYVSCNFKTFAEDYETLVHGESKVEGAIGGSKGQWKLRKAKGYIYYPGSLNCIETLAIFDRKR